MNVIEVNVSSYRVGRTLFPSSGRTLTRSPPLSDQRAGEEGAHDHPPAHPLLHS